MPDVIAFFSGAAGLVMIMATDWDKGPSSTFLIMLGIVAFVCIGALAVAAVERSRTPRAPSTCRSCAQEEERRG